MSDPIRMPATYDEDISREPEYIPLGNPAEGSKIAVKVVMDAGDFRLLCTERLQWSSQYAHWQKHITRRRFLPQTGTEISVDWNYAYWMVGTGYGNVILARAFLEAWGHEYQVIMDEAEPGSWVILTDYEWDAQD